MGDVAYFGIRHHGPGSAAALVAALDELDPARVLIEGPADATEILPLLADPGMKPPVALLAYPPGDPSRTAFWPFAEFSPEYQATLWATRHGVPVQFIDLPSTALLVPEGSPDDNASRDRRLTDPIAVLAEAAGYEDGESWWADLVEQNPAPGPIFAAVARAMGEVRREEPDDDAETARREAHMRLAIARAADGPVAVVCGAWHVPALTAPHTKTGDKATVGSLPRVKAQLTWAPWTSPRLAMGLGYGAGVAAPGWCSHLWATRGRDDAVSVWLTRIATVLRAKGHLVSTASLIEAQRLALALAAMRERPQPGFEELREACVSVLFSGETTLWRLVEDELLLGNDVGEIPAGVPLAPLIADFQVQVKSARLALEALERELSLDLRSDSGLRRSTLLHRLLILGVPWGRLTDAGRSRGTFRERWVLAYDPAYAVDLVTKLVYGPTIEQAAGGVLMEQFEQAASLTDLATGVRDALTAALPAAVERGLTLLQARAALSSDCLDILSTVPPLADVLRYGMARATDLESLGALVDRLLVEASINLVYSARGLDEDGAGDLAGLIERADAAVRLITPAADVIDAWTRGLQTTLDDKQTTAQVAGSAASLLYEAGDLGADEAVSLLARRLSPGTPLPDAAGFLEGFFASAAARLIYDAGLRDAVDAWLTGLNDDDFVGYLPLMRRVLSRLDATERKHLADALHGRVPALPSGLAEAPDGGAGWARHLGVIAGILTCLPTADSIDETEDAA